MKLKEFDLNLDDFKVHYNEAVEKEEKSFDYEGNVMNTDYAKYLIEYLESCKRK